MIDHQGTKNTKEKSKKEEQVLIFLRALRVFVVGVFSITKAPRTQRRNQKRK